jgi:hypothetical protein
MEEIVYGYDFRGLGQAGLMLMGNKEEMGSGEWRMEKGPQDQMARWRDGEIPNNPNQPKARRMIYAVPFPLRLPSTKKMGRYLSISPSFLSCFLPPSIKPDTTTTTTT